MTPVSTPAAPNRTHEAPPRTRPSWLPPLVFALAALCAVLPLIVNGCSCGHDFDFHLLSWMEAAHQWQHGVLKPVWAFTPAYNAGEPRLLFYPPLSWITGAALGMVLRWPAVPIAFTWLALFLCGLTQHRLLRRWTSPAVATLGGCLYIVNPYMLFVAYERTAYAELMAAAWMPLLLAAMLRERVTVPRVALPIALLWLTNAPAAVVGCYAVLLLGVARLLLQWRTPLRLRLRLAATVAAGVVLGLLLDAFYLLPMGWERRFVQLQLAVVPMARPDANFLFTWDKDAFHTHVLRQASWIALGTCAVGVLCGVLLLVRRRSAVQHFRSMHDRAAASHGESFPERSAIAALLAFTVAVFFLLTRPSAPLWHVGPELVYLQFPWRFLSISSAAAFALLALLLQRARWRSAATILLPAGVLTALLAGWFAGGHYFREDCADDESVQAQRTQFVNEDGVGPTDEYTPVGADNDDLPISAPPAWILRDADEDIGKHPRVPANAHPSPEKLSFVTPALPAPALLVVRLRQFPGWHTLRDSVEITPGTKPEGLLTVRLPAGRTHRIDVVYRTTPDQWAGILVSGVTLLVTLGVWRRGRSGTMEHQHEG